MKRYWGLALIGLLLNGCATHPSIPADPARDEVHLRALDAWTFDGRIALYNDAEVWNADLRWRQQGPRYDIHLSGPFGQGRARIRGDADGVTLETAERTRRGRDPETLFNQTLGWRIPVNGLQWWIRGLSAPSAQTNALLDAQGRLQRLRQDGWDIQFKRYVVVDGLALPGKVFLENPEWTVRLVIQDWRLPAR